MISVSWFSASFSATQPIGRNGVDRDRNGISQETGLLKEWPAEGPKLLWQAIDIGDGYSTPSIEGKRLYLISNKGMEDEYVQCLTPPTARNSVR